jgi:8-oxo-dGTP pyrophosphatase MutT (NUDIX family)
VTGSAAGRDDDPESSANRGNRLVPDRVLPPWMRPLVDAVDGMTLPRRLLDRGVTQAPPGSRLSAVLMLLADGPDGPDVLLTGRASTLRSHAGQPAFPGGRAEPGEDAITTALREAWEETGLEPSSVTPVALLPQLFLSFTNHLVRPVLGHWHTPGPVRPVNASETATVARVSIADLTDPQNRGQISLPGGYLSPAFSVAGLVVWGFTAGLLEILLDLAGWDRPWDRSRRFELPDFP